MGGQNNEKAVTPCPNDISSGSQCAHNKAFSQATVKALRTIKGCALILIGFVAAGELFIMLGNSDDRAGGIFIGILITFGSVVVSTTAAMFERIFQNAVDIKSFKELTV